jgi:hypothetical protein
MEATMLNYLVIYTDSDDETIKAYFQTLFAAQIYKTALEMNFCRNPQIAQLAQEWF